MAKGKLDLKEKIINTTTKMIVELGDVSEITVRDIALESEVGVGLINYHFQTKENLINICIVRIISKFIEELESIYMNLDMSPIDKLKHVFKLKCNFIVSNPEISKISMMIDLNSSGINDNTDQAAMVHLNVLRELFGNEKTDSELFTIFHTISSSIQVAFLRSNVFKLHTGIDFFDTEQREKFIDKLIEKVIGLAL